LERAAASGLVTWACFSADQLPRAYRPNAQQRFIYLLYTVDNPRSECRSLARNRSLCAERSGQTIRRAVNPQDRSPMPQMVHGMPQDKETDWAVTNSLLRISVRSHAALAMWRCQHPTGGRQAMAHSLHSTPRRGSARSPHAARTHPQLALEGGRADRCGPRIHPIETVETSPIMRAGPLPVYLKPARPDGPPCRCLP
jgi:hypothetical protein